MKEEETEKFNKCPMFTSNNNLDGKIIINENIGGYNNIGVGCDPMFGTTSTAYVHNTNKTIIDTIINNDSIEVVYKERNIFDYGYCRPNPRIYKEVYSRFDGTMNVVEGRYVAPEKIEESYEFD